jgi:hypothetical protein
MGEAISVGTILSPTSLKVSGFCSEKLSEHFSESISKKKIWVA